MKIKIIMTCLLFSTCSSTYALPREDIYHLMKSYILAIKGKNEKQLQSLVSSNYFHNLKRGNKLQNTFDKQDPRSLYREFDLVVKKHLRIKNTYLVNIKDKGDKQYSSYWYIVKKDSKKYFIDEMQYLD